MPPIRHPYAELVSRHARAEAAAWFLERYDRLDRESFAPAYAGAGRRLGMSPLTPSSDQALELERAGLLVPSGWPLSAVGRTALLCRMCEELPAHEHLGVVERSFKTGDNAEREALLRALILLPEPGRFVEVAVEACRSSVQSIFEAVACDNPYAARYFPDHNFNQLVLKAFFTGVPVARIHGLEQRRSPELARMAQDYASERRAAGRPVPPDLHLVEGARGAHSRSNGPTPN